MTSTGDNSVLSHQRQNPAKLLLVDSDDVGNGVEVLFGQHLFWHLWQQHSVHHGGQERVDLGKRAEQCLCLPFQVTPHLPLHLPELMARITRLSPNKRG